MLTGCGGSDVSEPASTVTETVTEVVTEVVTEYVTEYVTPPPPPPPPGPATTIDAPGTYVVGTDIQPGVWRNPDGCYWERLSGLSGEFGDIISNGGNEGGLQTVEVAASDAAFGTNCAGWTKAG